MRVALEITFSTDDMEKIAIAKCEDAHGKVIGGVRGEWVIEHSRYSYGDKDIVCKFVPENSKAVPAAAIVEYAASGVPKEEPF